MGRELHGEARETSLSAERLPPRRRLPVIGCGVKPLGAGALALLAAVTANDADPGDLDPAPRRPRTRGDCRGAARPCPWVSCRHHLYLEVNDDSGSIKINHPAVELEDLPDTCSLDVADRGGALLSEVGGHLSVTLERVRQMEMVALDSFEESARVILDGLPADRRPRLPRRDP